MRRLIILLSCLILLASNVQSQEAPSGQSFIEASVDNRTPYVGQTVTYTWRLFYAGDHDLQTARFEPPRFENLGQQPPGTPTGTNDFRDDTLYSVLSQDIVLTPSLPGQITIAPYRVILPETPFLPEIEILSNPVTLMVRPLPPDAPETYRNAIGQFDMIVNLRDDSVEVGEPVTLEITITGTGNVTQILAPQLDLPDVWRVFTTSPVIEQTGPRFGSKTFIWTLIPRTVGPQILAPINFSYFDPTQGEYITRTSAPLAVDVLPGDEIPGAPQQTRNSTLLAGAAPPLMPIPAVSTVSMPNTMFWVLWTLPPGFYGIVWLFSRTSARGPKPTAPRRSYRSSRSDKPAQQRRNSRRSSPQLRHIDQQLNSVSQDAPNEACAEMSEQVLVFISKKAGATIDRQALSEAIVHLPDSLQNDIQTLLDTLDNGRYAPLTNADVQDLLQQTRTTLVAVDEVWR